MASFPDFQKASFNGINFPYSQISVRGGIRHHVHEYPHSPGGDLEKMGRFVYRFRFKIPFHDLPGSKLDVDFPDLYPARLRNFIALWDRQATAGLTIPNIGTMPCVATQWDGVADMHEALSGETWDVEYTEDVDQASVTKTIPRFGVKSMVASVEELQTLADAHNFKPGLFQSLNDAIGAVDGLFGSADAYSRLVAGKIEGIAQLCAILDRDTKEFLDPMNHPVVEALKDVWANAQDLVSVVPGKGGGELSTFRVPRLMSIGQVATKLYGSADRSVDIMQINPIEDPFAITAGTQLLYVKAA